MQYFPPFGRVLMQPSPMKACAPGVASLHTTRTISVNFAIENNDLIVVTMLEIHSLLEANVKKSRQEATK